MGRVYHEFGTRSLYCEDETRDRCPICKLEAEVERLKDLIAAENELRPRWAQGYSSDSVAAQCSQAALSEIFKKLGVTNQTEAMQALEEK